MKSYDRLSPLLVTALLVSAACAAALPGLCIAETVQGSYWYIVDNILNPSPTAEGWLWVVLPSDRPGQRIEIVDIEPEPVALLQDEDQGNRIVWWKLEPPGESNYLFCHFDFTLENQIIQSEVDPARVAGYDKSSAEYQRFTRSEFGIETGPEIRALALEIVGEETNPYRQAKLVFDWMVANLDFGPKDEGEWSALVVSRLRKGDCGKFSILFTALCRSLGIPTRTLTCEWLTGGRHVLAEFQVPPYGWLPADPTAAQVFAPGFTDLSPDEIDLFMQTRGIPLRDPDWLFGNLYPRRLITSVGNNIEVFPPGGAEKKTFTYLQPGGREASPPAIELHGFGPDIVHGGFFHFGEDHLDPEAAHDLAHQKLADIYFGAGFLDSVEKGCHKTLATDPGATTTWMNLGKVYLRKGEYSKAEASFNRALRGQTSRRGEKLEMTIWVHNYLGACYDLMGRRSLAVAEYQKVLDQNLNYQGAVEFARRFLNSPFTVDDF